MHHDFTRGGAGDIHILFREAGGLDRSKQYKCCSVGFLFAILIIVQQENYG